MMRDRIEEKEQNTQQQQHKHNENMKYQKLIHRSKYCCTAHYSWPASPTTLHAPLLLLNYYFSHVVIVV